jgi:hypothetical protein
MLKVAKKGIQKNTNNMLLVRHGTQFKKKKSRSKKKPRVQDRPTCLRRRGSDLRMMLRLLL